MDRREFLIGTGALMATAARGSAMPLPPPRPVANSRPLARSESIQAWRARLRAMLDRGTVPIIDTEATFVGRIDIKFILREMDRHGVAQIAFAPIYSFVDGSAASLSLHRLYPAYFIPTTSDGLLSHWEEDTGAFVRAIGAEIKSGSFFFMGEHELRHYPSGRQWRAGKMWRDVTIPLDSDPVHELFRLSEETKVAFQIHYEIEDVLLPPLEAMLARYPGARVIWCHLGQIRYPDRSTRYGPAYVRSLIGRFPNLHFDLAVGGPGSVYPGSGARQSTIYEHAGRGWEYGGYLKGEWRAVLEDHPDRFLAASDIGSGRVRRFPKNISRLRTLVLAELSRRAQHLVAYQNAWRLITGEPWHA